MISMIRQEGAMPLATSLWFYKQLRRGKTPRYRLILSYPARIRTWTKRTKISCATVTLPGNGSMRRKKLALACLVLSNQVDEEGELFELDGQVHVHQADSDLHAHHCRCEIQQAADTGSHK